MKSLFLTENVGHPTNIHTSTLIAESVNRLETYYFEPEHLIYKDGKLVANCCALWLDDDNIPVADDEREEIIFDENIACTIRLDPPFDARYITALQMLEFYGNGARIHNSPKGILSQPEKIIPEFLQKYTPKTILTSDIEEVKEFWKENKDIVIKPLYDFAGNGIFRLREEEENHRSIFSSLKAKYKEQLVVQEYLPAVKKGDKRIVLLNGEYVGAFNRVPPKGQLQAAVAAGAKYEKTALTETEQKICNILKDYLKEIGITICGIDIIGDKLTEINTTCPAGMIMLQNLYDYSVAKEYWDLVLES